MVRLVLTDPRRHGGCTPRDPPQVHPCTLGSRSRRDTVSGSTPPISPLSPVNSCRSRVSRRFFNLVQDQNNRGETPLLQAMSEPQKLSGDMGYLLSETFTNRKFVIEYMDVLGRAKQEPEPRDSRDGFSARLRGQVPRVAADRLVLHAKNRKQQSCSLLPL